MVTSENACNNWVWFRPKLGTRNSVLVSHCGWQEFDAICCLPSCNSSKRHQNWSIQDCKWHSDMGYVTCWATVLTFLDIFLKPVCNLSCIVYTSEHLKNTALLPVAVGGECPVLSKPGLGTSYSETSKISDYCELGSNLHLNGTCKIFRYFKV